MKFDVVIGNPPYQEEASGESTGDNPIYHLFVSESFKIASVVCLITPGRYLFNAGKTPKKWNEMILNDEHIKIPYYVTESSEIFPNTSITGGISIVYRNLEENYGTIGTFSAYKLLDDIVDKVKRNMQQNLSEIIFVQNKFVLERLYEFNEKYKDKVGSSGKDKRVRANAFEKFEVFRTNKKDNDLEILGLINGKRTYRYINSDFLESVEWLSKYKVFVPESNGASGTLSNDSARIISKPVLGLIGQGITQTFICIGSFETKAEATNLLKYVKSKFLRVLLGSLKVTQRNNSETWKNIPLQDFTTNSDIDWTQSIADVDKQLYKKYDLTQEEIDFIETKVKEM